MNLMMLTNVLELDPTKELPGVAEKLQYGGIMLLLGMLTVFSVLAIICFSLVLFKVFFHDLPAKRKVAQKVEAAPIVEETTEPATNDDEIVAVIAAAIAMAESESNGIKFKVVSFRKI